MRYRATVFETPLKGETCQLRYMVDHGYVWENRVQCAPTVNYSTLSPGPDPDPDPISIDAHNNLDVTLLVPTADNEIVWRVSKQAIDLYLD